jgi:TonB family protein
LPPPPPPPRGAPARERPPEADSVWPRATPTEDPTGHRRKAFEGYWACLAANRGDTEELRRTKRLAFRAALEVSYADDRYKDGIPLSHADELAQQPSLEREDFVLLALVFERHGRLDRAEESYRRLAEANPSDSAVCQAVARFYDRPVWQGRTKFEETIGTLEKCAALTPNEPTGYYRLAVFLWDKAYRDTTLAGSEKLAYADRGLANVERALALKGDYADALVYKGLLLRVKNAVAPDAAPPPPTSAGSSAAVRVGSGIRSPERIKHVDPEYPEVARQAQVQGVVILECTIGPDGKVTDAKVLRGIPLLDAAAIKAVKQWVYAPTVLNGGPVAIIMTVTVNFRLP